MIQRIFSLLLVYALLATAAIPANAGTPVNIGYQGVLCEVTTYIAVEKGFFKEEGLDVTLVKGDWNTIKDGIASGKLQAGQGLLMNWLKPIEQGIDVKLTMGLHTGCLKIIAAKSAGVTSVTQLKGKRVGVPSFGSSQHLLTYRATALAGLNPEKDIQWRIFPLAELKIALEKGEVDAVAVSDPIGAIIERDVPSVTLIDTAKTKPYSDEYCCLLGINGKLVKTNPELAAKISRAYAKSALWISRNRAEAADIVTANKYIPIDKDFAAQIVEHYDYQPSTNAAKTAVLFASKELKKVGILAASTDPERFAKYTFAELPGLDQYKNVKRNYGKY
jgi:NitT/TauT family transport system substrate-binding protein